MKDYVRAVRTKRGAEFEEQIVLWTGDTLECPSDWMNKPEGTEFVVAINRVNERNKWRW